MPKQKMEDKKYFAYMVCCSDDTLYSGFTTDLARREKAHNSPKGGARYTKTRQPVHMVYHEMFDNKSDAMKREAAYKKLTRDQKLELIASQDPKEAKRIRRVWDQMRK